MTEASRPAIELPETDQEVDFRETMKASVPVALGGAVGFALGTDFAVKHEGLKLHPTDADYHKAYSGTERHTGSPPMEHSNALQVGTIAVPAVLLALGARELVRRIW